MAKADDPKKLERDAAEVTAKIVAAYEKLAGKLREKSHRAEDRLKSAKSENKRAMYRRRFELYGDAAQDLDERLRAVRGRLDRDNE
ncbi:hypothetical protein [Methylobacterium soli]|uniref:Uncharacterized protein n=1 Tax=Methylobacterium soli TaxID=553447 RepID=A0A6L3SPV2_9HYPH|nr:hypothetical protein [Methylobacterium soli]KAB1072231.1 hypothetical protein F6X53_28410 [Methylobacterium soli]GJE45689.1 hypothetical protein AEGHOMDF_4889 [Methylobacterium soli]